ncbi:MAG: TIR domain-containing protein [Hyphomonadaceae bacterium]
MADAAKSLKVFVSYSRTDVEFADQLVLALEDKGFQTILDRHDMSGGENWRERLGKLILSADAVTFILSEKSAASEICAWEVEEARRLSKRILPVTPASVANVKPPQALSDLNWIPFFADPAVPGSGFYYGVKRLEEALRIDLDWLRAQTRYLERSSEWTKAARAEDLLLRGEALREAHAWLSKTPAGSSPPDGVREYLSASADAEQKREAAARLQIEEREKAVKVAEAAVTEKQQAVAAKARTDRLLRMLAMSALVAGVLLVALAGVGVWFASKNFVDSAERDAKLFAREANVLSAKGDKVLAMLVALSGDPAAKRGLLEQWFRPGGYPAAREALARAYATNRLVMSVPTGEPITAMAPFADDKRFITFHKGGVARVWEVGNPAPVRSFKTTEDVKQAKILKDGERALMLFANGRAVLVRLTDGSEQQVFAIDDSQETTSAAIDHDEKRVLTGGIDGRIELWNVGTASQVMRWEAAPASENNYGDPAVHGLAFSANEGEGFFSADGRGMVAQWSTASTAPIKKKELGEDVYAASLISAGSDFISMVLVGANNGRLYGLETRDIEQPVRDVPVFDAIAKDVAVTGLIVGRSGINALAISDTGSVVVFRDGYISRTEFGSAADITAAVQVADGQTAVTGSRDGTVRQWSLEKSAAELLSFGRQASEAGVSQAPPPRDVVLSGDGQQALLLYFNDETSKLWRRNGSPETSELNAQKISADGQFVVRLNPSVDRSKSAPRERDVVRLSDGKVVHTISAEQTPLGFVRSEGVLLEASDGSLSIWKFGAKSPEWTTGKPEERGYSGAFDISPDGSRVIANFDNRIKVWKVGQAKPEADLPMDAHVTVARFLPDNSRFALGLETGGIEIWSVGNDRPLESFDGHTSDVQTIAFSRDKGLMATASTDRSAILWRIGQREPLQVFDIQGSVYSMMFEPSGKQVLIATMDGISAWEIEPVALADANTQVRLACERLEQLNVHGFSSRDVLTVPSLRGLPENPCTAMGITQPKTVAVMANPAAPAARTWAGSPP